MSVEVLGPLEPEPLPEDYRPPRPPAWLTEQQRPGETPFDACARAFLLQFSSPHTRGDYAGDLARWRAFLASATDPLIGAEAQHVDAFARSLEVAGYSANTRRRRLSVVSSFYDYAIRRGARRGENPARYTPRPPVPTGRRRTLSRVQAVALLEVADTLEHEYRLRDALILRLFLYLALRVSEVCRLDLRDLDRATGQIVVRGKGGTETRMDAPEEVWAAVVAYLPHRLPPASMTGTDGGVDDPAAADLEVVHPGGRGRTREPLFYLHRPHLRGAKPSHGPRMTADAITSRLRAIAAETPEIPPALAAALTPHDLRRTALSELSKVAPFAEVRRTGRHARADTTLLYIQPDPETTGPYLLAGRLEPDRAARANAARGAGGGGGGADAHPPAGGVDHRGPAGRGDVRGAPHGRGDSPGGDRAAAGGGRPAGGGVPD